MNEQVWNINLDLKHEALDLSRFRKEFVEYIVSLHFENSLL